MLYRQLQYQRDNREKIKKIREKKAEEHHKLNKFYKVDNLKHPGRNGFAWKGERLKCMRVIRDKKFIITFD